MVRCGYSEGYVEALGVWVGFGLGLGLSVQ